MKSTQMNVINAALMLAFSIAVVWYAARAQWPIAVLFLVVIGGSIGFMRRARRGAGGDLARLDTGYAVDEREVRLAERALSWVGVAAVVLQLGFAAWELANPGQPQGFETARAAALAGVGLLANRVVLRQQSA